MFTLEAEMFIAWDRVCTTVWVSAAVSLTDVPETEPVKPVTPKVDENDTMGAVCIEGAAEGLVLVPTEGDALGAVDGLRLGEALGETLVAGADDGATLGATEGTMEPDTGAAEGAILGTWEGAVEGAILGT
jgi:hypothetical protein